MLYIALVCIAVGVYWLWNQRKESPDEPPYLPGAWPIIGHVPLVTNSSKFWTYIKSYAEESYRLGGVVRCKIGPKTVYVVTDPDDMFTIANTCLEKDPYYDFAKPWLGDGLLTAQLSIWKQHRKLLNPANNQIVLDTFMGAFNSQSRKLVHDLQKEVGNGLFDHLIYIKHNTLETICLTALGVDFTDPMLNNKYIKATELIHNIVFERVIKFWWQNPQIFRFSYLKKKQDKCLKILHNMSNTVLQRKKSEYTGNICAERSEVSETNFKAFMDLLLELSAEKGVLNDREIREHVDTMIFAGYDTSANVLVYTMLLLGAHPEVQEKVAAEIKDVLGDRNRDVEKQDLSKLVYLEAVLKESMRIYPIGPTIARKIDKDIKLKNSTLTAGRTCFLAIFAVQLHPVWGSDRYQFRPERWFEPSQLPRNPNAFAAFSVGRRICYGKNFAYMSMKTTLVHVIRKYRIIADVSQLKLKIDLLLKPESGYYISIVERR